MLAEDHVVQAPTWRCTSQRPGQSGIALPVKAWRPPRTGIQQSLRTLFQDCHSPPMKRFFVMSKPKPPSHSSHTLCPLSFLGWRSVKTKLWNLGWHHATQGEALQSPGLGTVNEYCHPVSSGLLQLKILASEFKHCKQDRGKVCNNRTQ